MVVEAMAMLVVVRGVVTEAAPLVDMNMLSWFLQPGEAVDLNS